MTMVNRRQMLGVMGGAMALGIGAGALGGVARDAGAMPVEEKPFSWTPRVLETQEIMPLAHERFYHQGFGCGYGVFYSIIGTMGQKWGEPYRSFPFSMMEMGKSGVSEWGTLRGALLGAVAAMAMFWGRKERDPMVDELFRWYELTAFPMYRQAKGLPVGLDIELPTSVADSVLCHISVGKWAYSSGLAAQGKERSERCARLTADVAGKTVEIMNAKINNTFAVSLGASETRKSCNQPDCHGGEKDKFVSPTLKGKMDCTPCHTGSEHVQNKLKDHP